MFIMYIHKQICNIRMHFVSGSVNCNQTIFFFSKTVLGLSDKGQKVIFLFPSVGPFHGNHAPRTTVNRLLQRNELPEKSV